MQTISINFIIPSSWTERSDKQLRYVYQLIASEYATDDKYSQQSDFANITEQSVGRLLVYPSKFRLEP